MRFRLIFLLLLVGFGKLIFSCSQNAQKLKMSVSAAPTEQILDNRILTREEQAELTPGRVMEILNAGNEIFREDKLTIRNTSGEVRNAALGQYPKAVILSGLDSRVPVEDIFHRGMGDIFVTRVAGNVVNEDILGSLEYACKISGSKLVMVLGHEYCGAVKAAIEDVEFGNMTRLIEKIKPAVQAVKDTFPGDPSSANPHFVKAVCHANILRAVNEIREKSPILREMENNGEIAIVGAVYDMDTGRVAKVAGL